MKYILTILFFLIAYAVNAQYIPNASAYSYKGVLTRQSLQMPQGCGDPITGVNAPYNQQSAFYWDSCADQLYTFSPKQQIWLTTQSGIDSIFITTSDSIFIITSNNDTIFIGTANNGMDTAYTRNDTIFGVKAGIEFFVADISGTSGGGGGGSGIPVFNNMAGLATIADTINAAHVLGYYLPNDGGGGFFYRNSLSSADPVNGMIIQPNTGSGRMIRVAADTYNLRWFGARGVGIAGYQQDSAALKQAIEFIRGKGYGSLYVPASDSPYCYAGLGLVSPDNFSFYGDGIDKTKWLYVNMNYSPDYYNGTFLFFGTFATTPGANMTRVPRYQIFDVTKGQTTVKLRNIADAGIFTKGELIKLASRAYNKGNEAGKTIWRCNSFHIITRISNDTLFLDHAAIMDIPRDDPAYALYEVTNGITSASDTGSAVIFRPNAGVTSNAHLGTDKMSVNVSVHDMSFDVSPFDYVNGTPYDSTIVRSPGNIFSLGSVYGLNLYNLRLNAFGNFGGQYYSNFNIQNLHVTSARKVFDFGNESSEGFLNGIFYRYKNEFYDTTDVAMVYINNHSHNIAIMNLNVTGAYEGRNAIQIDGGVHDIAMTNIRMDLPNFGTSTNDVFHITTQDTVEYTYPSNLTFTDIDILVGSARRYISWVGQPHTDWNYNGNIIFRNLTFRGTVSNDKPVFFDNADTIYAANILQPVWDSVHILNTTYLRTLFPSFGSNPPRDLLPHSPGFGILGSDYDGTTPQTWSIDTSVLNGQIFIDSSNIEFFVDSISNAPLGTEATGTKYLVGTSPTGDFAGHANEIAELTGAVWSFIVPDTSDNLVVTNETQPTSFYHFDGTNWNLQRRSLSIGGDQIGARIDIGTIDNQRLRFITNGGYREEISNTGHFFRRYQGARSNNYLKIVDTATGRMDTASFTPLVLTTNGSSGASTLSNDTLNIPIYTGGGGGGGIDSLQRNGVGLVSARKNSEFIAQYYMRDTSYVYANAFGAIGDSLNGNYAAILAAYNALPEKGGVIIFGSGNYRLDTQIVFNKPISIRGVGKSSANTSTPVYTTKIQTHGNSAIRFNTLGSSARDMVIENLNRDSTGTSTGIWLQYARWCIIDNVAVTGFANGVDVRAGGYYNISNSMFTNGIYDIKIQDTANSDEGDAAFYGNTFFAASSLFQSCVYQINGAGSKFYGNKFDLSNSTSTTGTAFTGAYSGPSPSTSILLFNGNSIENFRRRGISIQADGNYFLGRMSITGNQFATNNTGICAIYMNSSTVNMLGVSIMSNVFHAGTADTAIYVDKVSNLIVSNSYENITTPVRYGTNIVNTGFEQGYHVNGTNTLTLGVGASAANNTGTTAIGVQAMGGTTSRQSTTAVGYQAGLNNTGAQQGVIIGYQADAKSQGAVSVGYDAGGTGVYSVMLGYNAGNALTTAYNIGLGAGTVRVNTSGGRNIGIGYNALNVLATGSDNIAIGHEAMLNAKTGSGNTVIGQTAAALPWNISNASNYDNTIYIHNKNGHDSIASTTSSVVINDTSFSTFTFDVNGTGKFRNTLTTTGNIVAFAAKTTTYTATATDEILTGDATGAAFQITLPTAVGRSGQRYTIKKIDASANAVTVGTTSSQTIDGSTTYALGTQYKYVTIVSNGANWLVISNN